MATGWYVDLGAGWDKADNAEYSQQGFQPFTVPTSDSALIVGSIGYRLANRLRFEGEVGYDSRSLQATNFGAGGSITGGSDKIWSFMANAAYDFPLGPKWDFTVGAGAGFGELDAKVSNASTSFSDSHRGYMWQGFAGFDYWVRRDVSLNLDWRYRELAENKAFFGFPVGDQVHLKNLKDNALVLSARWYPWAAAPPPPPPPMAPPPPPPPPMAPPPPTKTFIVFFDFNKSNLTAEAQAVVSEAVKTAKSNGMVRVMVTGHTDTVGSDSYNQGLSVRRAESVKDEMVREGMDGSTISIEGKSFHDPLVPTGPGVREPQNRRAVIDLGG